MRLGNERQAKQIAAANGYGYGDENPSSTPVSNGSGWNSDDDDADYSKLYSDYTPSDSSEAGIWVIVGVVAIVIIIVIKRKKKH